MRRKLYGQSRFEKDGINGLAEFYKPFLPGNVLVFDIGANIGRYTEAYLLNDYMVISIEPNPDLAKYLKWSFIKNVKVEQIGISNKNGYSEFFLSDNNLTSTLSDSFRNLTSSNRNRQFKTIKIKIRTIDSLIEQYGEPYYCKIDVEGHEYEVLQGLSSPIQLISFEYHIPELANNLLDCLNYIEAKWNYSCNYIEGENKEFKLHKNITIGELRSLVNGKNFSEKNYGDIFLFYRKDIH